MQRNRAILFVCLLALLLAAAGPLPREVTSPTGSFAPAHPEQTWRSGVTCLELAPYACRAGRPASLAPVVANNQGIHHLYFTFPAPGRPVQIQEAHFTLVSKVGNDHALLPVTLEVLDLTGAVRATASAAPANLGGADSGSWQSLALSETPADLWVHPGEFLAFHLALDPAAGPSLTLSPAFEVRVREFADLPAPAMTRPADGSLARRAPEALVWEAVPGAAGYLVNLDGATLEAGSSLTLALPDLAQGAHAWAVTAYDAAGIPGRTSPAWNFTFEPYRTLYLPLILSR